jgi:hypothetical protein
MQDLFRIIVLTVTFLVVAVFTSGVAEAVVPSHRLENGAVSMPGIGPDNPIIYDNDWWFDVFDNNYLWAQASLGEADLRGNIVTRDMWDWQKGYLYPMDKCVADARKALKFARESGLKNVPDLTIGSDQVLKRPESGEIEDTVPHPSDGSRLIVSEAKKATPEKPLLVISGGPLTTVANALLTHPEIAENIVVFNLTVSSYGYNGKDAWSPYIVAKKTRLIEWATGTFWDKNSVFTKEHFEALPKNPFCDDMRRLIATDLGQANQLGDGAALVWLWRNDCWTNMKRRKAVWHGPDVRFEEVADDEAADVLDIPKSATDLKASREEFFRVLTNPKLFAAKTNKPRVVVLTDISNEPDDQMSLVRFLTYANEFDVEGILATTSCWRKKDPDLPTIKQVIDAYGKAYQNLTVHASGFPTAEQLQSVTLSGVDGYSMSAAADQLDNAGIAHIIKVLEKDDPRPVWFCAWGGGNTLGGAVMKLQRERPDDAARLVSKIRGYEIALQDDGFAYIAHHFPEAKLISARLLWKGISKTVPKFNNWPESWGGNNDVFNAAWIKQHVQDGHGPLGEQYPSADYLWEGDTPSFLYLMPNGLSDPEHVHYGSWGGRFDPERKKNVRSGTGNGTVDNEISSHDDYHLFSDAVDSWTYQDKRVTSEYATVFRWREHFQNDFAARMDWCIADDYKKANHNPIAVLNGDRSKQIIKINAKPGDTITLSSEGSSDPDGNATTSHWMVYPEAGTYEADAKQSNKTGTGITLSISDSEHARKTMLHVILTLQDNGSPSLVSYRRAIISIN